MDKNLSKECLTCGKTFYKNQSVHESYKRWKARKYCSCECAYTNRSPLTGDTKKCVKCDKIIHKNGQPQKRWKARKYCSNECRYSEADLPIKLPQSKKCPTCGKLFYRNRGEFWKKWRDRKYCNRKCFRERKLIQREKKKCIRCDKAFERKPYECVKRWKARKYCNTKCHMEAVRNNQMIKCQACEKLFKASTGRTHYCNWECMQGKPLFPNWLKVLEEMIHPSRGEGFGTELRVTYVFFESVFRFKSNNKKHRSRTWLRWRNFCKAHVEGFQEFRKYPADPEFYVSMPIKQIKKVIDKFYKQVYSE